MATLEEYIASCGKFATTGNVRKKARDKAAAAVGVRRKLKTTEISQRSQSHQLAATFTETDRMERYSFTAGSIEEVGHFLIFLSDRPESSPQILFANVNVGLDIEVFSELGIEELRDVLQDAAISPAMVETLQHAGQENEAHNEHDRYVPTEQPTPQQAGSLIQGYKNDPFAEKLRECEDIIGDHVMNIDGNGDLISLLWNMAEIGTPETTMQSFANLANQHPETATELLWASVSVAHFSREQRCIQYDIEQRAAMN